MDAPNGRDVEGDKGPSPTDELVDIISDPIHDITGAGLGSGRKAAREVLALLGARGNRKKVWAWLDDTDREVALLRSILAKLHEIGPAGRPWGEVTADTLFIDEQEHGEGVRFQITRAEAAAFHRARRVAEARGHGRTEA